jgi:signal transduction histidine kinase
MSSEEGDDESGRGGGTWASITSGLGRLLPGVIRRHYAAKFVVAFLLVVVVIAVVGGSNFLTIQDTIESESADKLQSTAQVRTDIVSQWVRSMEAQARLVSSSDVFATQDNLLIRLYLQRAEAEGTSGVVAIHYVTTANWTITESTDVAYQGVAVSSVDEPWTDDLKRMQPSMRVPATVRPTSVAYRAHGETVVAFMSPTPRTNAAVVLVSSIERPIAQFDQFPTLSTTIVNADGQPLISGANATGRFVLDRTAFEATASNDTVQYVEGSRDIEVYAPVQGTEWVTVTSSPRSSVFQSARAVSRNVRDIIAASVLALALVALVLGRHTVVPLARLRRQTQKLQEGDFDVDLSTDRVDEVGRLFQNFDEMRVALQQQMTEVQESRERLQQQNERLETFVNMLSHDLRNPLMVVRGRLEAIEESIPDEHVAPIERNVRRMEAIIDDVLTLARQDQWSLDTAPVRLSAIVKQCWDTTTTEDAVLVVETDGIIDADERHLQHLFENLIRNAVEHGGDGPVTVRVGTLDGGFYVEDDGPGIPEEERDDVTEAGYSTVAQGTGLGLNIVQNIADSHGWTVVVTESDDGGARFEFSGADVE